MSTRFFENQDAARRNTKRLVFLFCLAVVAIAAMLYVLAVLLTGVQQPDRYTREVEIVLQWWQPDLLIMALEQIRTLGTGRFWII